MDISSIVISKGVEVDNISIHLYMPLSQVEIV